MTKKYQLKNGLNVLLIESHKSPVVSIQMWVKTGSADETKGIEGISHFIEHLVFKGSDRFKVGEIAQAIEGAGGLLNAYTTFDQTVFYVTLSREFVDTGLEAISQMVSRPLFDEKEIDNEREVVIEEIKRSNDSPSQQASRLLFSTIYNKHPYGVPIIGYDSNIKQVSRNKITDYFNSRYLPNNMNLVVVGDFSAAGMKKKISINFDHMKKRKLQKVVRAKEPNDNKPRIVVKPSNYTESYLYFSWPAPAITHKDYVPLALLAVLLGQGDSSRLVHKLRNEKKLVTSIGCSQFSPKDQGFFAISAHTSSPNILAIFDEIRQELQTFFEQGATQEEMAKATRIVESDKFYSMETVDGLAGLYGQFEFLYNDYRHFDKQLTQLRKLTAADLLRVAKKYLDPCQLRITALLGKEAKLSDESAKEWADDFLKLWPNLKMAKNISSQQKKIRAKNEVWKIKSSSKAGKIEKITLSNGLRVAMMNISGSPVASMRVGALGGLRFENGMGGLNELTTRIWTAGYGSLTEQALNHEIENLASSLNSFGGRNTVGLSLTSLPPFIAKAAEHLSGVLQRPLLPEDAIEREKKLMMQHLQSRADKPSQVCMLNLIKNIFPHHPYGQDPYGDKGSIDKLTQQHVRSYLDSVLNPEDMVVGLVGDLSNLKMRKQIFKNLEAIKKKSRTSPQFDLPKLESSKSLFAKFQKEQTHIALAYRGLTFTDQRRHILDVLQSILSGQGGRLFIELRDKESLAYSVSPIRMDGIEGGYFGAYIGCSPEKAKKALSMLKSELIRLAEGPIFDDELERAKKYLIGRHDIALQGTGHIADTMMFDELYQVGFNDFLNFKKHMSSVTSKEVQSLARELFVGPHIVSVAGVEDVSI